MKTMTMTKTEDALAAFTATVSHLAESGAGGKGLSYRFASAIADLATGVAPRVAVLHRFDPTFGRYRCTPHLWIADRLPVFTANVASADPLLCADRDAMVIEETIADAHPAWFLTTALRMKRVPPFVSGMRIARVGSAREMTEFVEAVKAAASGQAAVA